MDYYKKTKEGPFGVTLKPDTIYNNNKVTITFIMMAKKILPSKQENGDKSKCQQLKVHLQNIYNDSVSK